jgi:DNA-binding NarL/FixJ family response regulator
VVFELPAPGIVGIARVVIVDADRRVRRDLAGLLALGPGLEIVGTAADAASAMSLVETQLPDLVVVDPRLPHVDDGLAFVAGVRGRSAARIVVLCHDEALRDRAVSAGADLFLTEAESPAAVMAAICECERR